MYARVVTVQVQPGKMDEFWRRIREGAVADAKAAPVGGAEGGPLRDLLTKPAVVAYYELSMRSARDT
jgi:hypothetical protein